MHLFTRSKITVTLLLILVLVASLGLLISTKVITHAASTSASISLTPPSGPPTSTTYVFGSGFGSSETVVVMFDTKSLGTGTTDSSGYVDIKIHISSAALPGNHTVIATGQTSGLSAQAIFVVQTNWSMFGFDPQQTHFNPYENVLTTANVSQLTLDWKLHTKGVFYLSSPAVSNGIVYINAGPLYALDEHTGAVIWQAKIYGNSSPVVANGIVFIGTGNGPRSSVTALNAQTGTVIWTYPLNGITSTPIESDGTLYVGSIRGNRGIVLALREQNGTLKWSFETKYTISAVSSSMGTIYVGAGKLYALDSLTGLLNWKASFSRGHFASVSSLAIANGIVYIGSYDDHLYALDAQTGTTKWSYLTGGHVLSSPAVANGVVYVGSDDGSLYAFHLPGTNP